MEQLDIGCESMQLVDLQLKICTSICKKIYRGGNKVLPKMCQKDSSFLTTCMCSMRVSS